MVASKVHKCTYTVYTETEHSNNSLIIPHEYCVLAEVASWCKFTGSVLAV